MLKILLWCCLGDRSDDDVDIRDFAIAVDGTVNREWCRILDLTLEELKGLTRATISLPLKKGGLGCPTLKATMATTYTASVMQTYQTMKAYAPQLAECLAHSVSKDGHDEFGFNHNYRQVVDLWQWFDGSEDRGNAKVKVNQGPEDALMNGGKTAKKLSENYYQRLHMEVQTVRKTRSGDMSKKKGFRDKAKCDIARLASSGGPTAYYWLMIPPREVRTEIRFPKFKPHLFKIALRLRLGLPMEYKYRQGKCRCKSQGNNLDDYGRHLLGCKWGGWCDSRHDNLNRTILGMARAAGNTAGENATNAIPAYYEVTVDNEGETTTTATGVYVYADGWITRTDGQQLLVDTGITSVPRMKQLQAAQAYEDIKTSKYERHKRNVLAQEGHYPDLKVIPLIWETHGAAGTQTQQLISNLQTQYREEVLPDRDQSASSVFNSAWGFSISTKLQIGNAEMIHNIVVGNRAYNSQTRRAKCSIRHDDQAAGERPHCSTCTCNAPLRM